MPSSEPWLWGELFPKRCLNVLPTNLLITILSGVIIAGIGAVIWLSVATRKPCNENEYVYCGNTAAAEHDEHAEPEHH
jgi:hypothetical protein